MGLAVEEDPTLDPRLVGRRPRRGIAARWKRPFDWAFVCRTRKPPGEPPRARRLRIGRSGAGRGERVHPITHLTRQAASFIFGTPDLRNNRTSFHMLGRGLPLPLEETDFWEPRRSHKQCVRHTKSARLTVRRRTARRARILTKTVFTVTNLQRWQRLKSANSRKQSSGDERLNLLTPTVRIEIG